MVFWRYTDKGYYWHLKHPHDVDMVFKHQITRIRNYRG